MLDIKNIDKIVGRRLYGTHFNRMVMKAGNYADAPYYTGNDYFQFVINEVPGIKSSNDADFDDKQVIVLAKQPGNRYDGSDDTNRYKYEMFTMGLQACTSTYLTIQDIKKLDTLIHYLELVMDKTKQFYNNNNN